MKKNNKNGFTLVEILAVIVIIAILSTGIIYLVSHYLTEGKKVYDESLRKQIELAAKSYYADNKDKLPRREGEHDAVTLKELASLNYFKNEVIDSKKNSCMDRSYVTVSMPDGKTIYTVCLICGPEKYLENNAICTVQKPKAKPSCVVGKGTGNSVKVTVTSEDFSEIENLVISKGTTKLETITDVSSVQTFNFDPGVYTASITYTDAYGNEETIKCSESATIADSDMPKVQCNATSTKVGEKLNVAFTLTNKELVNSMVLVNNITGTKKTWSSIPSSPLEITDYGSYNLQYITDSGTFNCGDTLKLQTTPVSVTKYYVSASDYKNIYNSTTGSISTIGLEPYRGTWENGYVYVKINNRSQYSSISYGVSPNFKTITDQNVDYFWISTQKEITTTVKATGKDNNASSTTLVTKLDRTTPTVTIAAKKKSAGTTVSSGIWSNQGLNFTLTKGTTGPSGYTIYYCKDTSNTCTPGTKATSGTAITSYNTLTGTYYIRYKIKGNTGLESSIKSYTAKVDTTTPTVTLAAKKKSAGTTVSSGVWSNEGLNFTLTKGTTGVSGYTIYYCKDTANTCTPEIKATSGTTITSYNTLTGTYYIRYKIVGGNGLSSSVKSYTAKVDTKAPTLTVKNSSGGSWTNDDVTITATASDSGSGIKSNTLSYKYKISGEDWNENWLLSYWTTPTSTPTTSATKKYTENTNRLMKVRVCDNAGNCTVSDETTIKIDKTAPTLTVKNSSDGDWTNDDVTISASASDSRSGIKSNTLSYKYKISGEDWNENWLVSYWTTPTSTPTTSATKKYTSSTNRVMKVRVCDNAGNCTISNETKIRIDKTAPTITFSANKSITDGGWYKTSDSSPFKVTVKCDASTSGVSSFKLGGDADITVSGSSRTITFSKPHRPYTIKATCKDNAGNSTTKTKDYYIRIYDRDSSCGCATYKSCEASACGAASCRNKSCSCATYSYDWVKTDTGLKSGIVSGTTTISTALGLPQASKTTCNSSRYGDYGYSWAQCIKCKRAGAIPPECQYTETGAYVTNNLCVQYSYNRWQCQRECTLRNSCASATYCGYKSCRTSSCGCETYSQCWHY